MTGLDVALLTLAAAFAIALVRAVAGPSLADRAVAADVCLYTVVAAMGLLSVRLDSETFVDVALGATLLGFLATVALARAVDREDRR